MSFLVEVNGGAGHKWQAPAGKAAPGQPWTCGSTSGRGVVRGNASMPGVELRNVVDGPMLPVG